MDEIDDDDAVLDEGGPLDALMVGDAVVTQAEVPVLGDEHDLDALFGEDEDEEDLGEDDLALDDLPAPDPRMATLESTVRQLAGAQAQREQRRVRRKVTAATGGAGVVGFIPILLQLVGGLDLDPELASAVVAGAAALGALVAGYMTPERVPPALDLLD
ncbi:MAG TPA: hypothetical protein VFG79_09865 [Solirubrobacter sp.]|nr:hypothetical protein [Solirubrobacter sp.]